MAIGHYIKEIGRGKDGARALGRAQACDLFGQILDGQVSDLELGAFCIAMRIKGETPEEMCGFLDATHARLKPVPVAVAAAGPATVVIPSYNGARKLPALTPLLALLLARRKLAVVVHGTATEDQRVSTATVLEALGIALQGNPHGVQRGQVAFYPTEMLHGGLHRLLEVRRTLKLRNPAHSLVKLLAPCAGPQVLVTSYTHPEYAVSMAQVLCQMQSTALLLRGTEGEAVADPRRLPRMQCIVRGSPEATIEHQPGTLASLPDLPGPQALATAAYIQDVLDARLPLPEPIALQVEQIVRLAEVACVA